jgi:hypothetical protein
MLEMNELFSWARSGSLRFQFFSVEVFSLLPQSQRDRCNLARQRQPHHGWLDALGEGSLVKVLEWSGLYACPGRSGFKQCFQT